MEENKRRKKYCERCAPDECYYPELCETKKETELSEEIQKDIVPHILQLVGVVSSQFTEAKDKSDEIGKVITDICKNVESKLQQIENSVREEMKVTGEISDGYHTFNELYEFRMLYNAALFNEWAKHMKDGFIDPLYDVHKSWKHSDGEPCFGGGWFIVMAETPAGQISNHYEEKDWDKFNIPEKEKANKWDGHTAQDVAERLTKYLTLKKQK